MSEPTVPQGPVMTLEKRRELVIAAINRIHAARSRYQESQLDPYADSDDRNAAFYAMKSTESEFAWQFENVEALLRGEEPEAKTKPVMIPAAVGNTIFRDAERFREALERIAKESIDHRAADVAAQALKGEPCPK